MDMTQTDLPGAGAIDSYIGRVDAAARGLPPDRRIELLDQLREHLETVSHVPGATEASVLAAIDRLGDPAEIVARRAHSASATPASSIPKSMGTAGDHGCAPTDRRGLPHSDHRTIGRPDLRLALTGVDSREKWIATLLGSGAIVVAAALTASLFGAF